MLPDNETRPNTEVIVGKRLRDLRIRRGLTLRALAECSGLNVNTLSLIENGKSSPSVSTLQLLAIALDVPIASFFATEPIEKRVIFTPSNARPRAVIGSTCFENLSQDLAQNAIQSFMVTVSPDSDSGSTMIVHTGHEFVYCLSGTISYQIDQAEYLLRPGDSLVFESHLPHCWKNPAQEPAQFLLLLQPSDHRDSPGVRHFSANLIKREVPMKIAVITDDETTISKHFGRARYYLVLSIENGKVTQRELRPKLGHREFSTLSHAEHTGHSGHGFDAASHDKHTQMAQPLSDCSVLICGGMGMGAYESLRRLEIEPLLTEIENIDDAVQAFLTGTLSNQTDLLHLHI